MRSDTDRIQDIQTAIERCLSYRPYLDKEDESVE